MDAAALVVEQRGGEFSGFYDPTQDLGYAAEAIGLIKATPAYKTAMAEAKVEGFGDCKEPCTKDEADAKCKACLADVTVPAYCAGHAGTKGC